MQDTAYITAKFEPTKDTTYPALTGELWGVFCENMEKKLTALQQHHTALVRMDPDEGQQEKQANFISLIHAKTEFITHQ